jgi:hypothetical protein
LDVFAVKLDKILKNLKQFAYQIQYIFNDCTMCGYDWCPPVSEYKIKVNPQKLGNP